MSSPRSSRPAVAPSWRRGFRPATALPAVVAGLVAARAWAGGAQVFEQRSREDFELGEATGTAVTSDGAVVPGLTASRVTLDASFVWTAAAAPAGRGSGPAGASPTIYLGTGPEGKVYAVQGSSARLVASLPEPWVTALCALPDGRLLAATTPGGKVYRIDPARSGPDKGGAELVVTLAAGHVWALVHDAQSGRVFAATGQDGKVFEVEAASARGPGRARLHWDSKDAHVVSLVAGPGGTLLAGTAEEAILYSIAPDGSARALHDFEASEVRAIARGSGAGGALYVAVNEFTASAGASPAPGAAGDGKASGTRIQVVAGARSPASAGELPRPGAPKAKGALYRLLTDGSIEQIHALPDAYFTALLPQADGGVLAASGSDGRIYRVTAERQVSVVADLPERQTLTLTALDAGARGAVLAGTGDVGAAFRLVPAAPADATYLSRVFDAGRPARWGRLVYEGPRALAIETRSGNTARPDHGWEPWQPLAGARFDGSEEAGGGVVASAPGRYVQYRLRVPDGAALRRVQLHYLPQNLRARVVELTVEGDKKGAASGGGEPGKRRAHSSVLKLRWKVDNPDDDPLVYRLSYRAPSEPGWRPLAPPAGGEPLTRPEHDWETESIPDGRYLVRVWASDEQEVEQDRALAHEYVAPALVVDNTRPLVSALAASGARLTGRAEDAASPIAQVEVSVDGGPWRPAAPEDGLFDSRQEAFRFQLPALPPGVHVVAVRAWDARDNVGAAKLELRIK